MRKKRDVGPIILQGIAGSNVVLLGINYPKSKCNGLLGFGIHRTDHETDEAIWLRGMKTFKETDPGFQAGSTYSTREHPVQGFVWSDYEAEPGKNYTYKVIAWKGTPTDLLPVDEESVKVKTEDPLDGKNDVYFNRGVAASQQYARLFGETKPDVIGKAAYDWLSRGLYEAMVKFIAQAKDGRDELLVSAYEFHYEPVLHEFKKARDRGVTVRVIYDHRKESPGDKNKEATLKVGIKSLCEERTKSKSAISHNKFIIYLRDGRAKAVLTGGTNFSEGGIFGHSNVVHVVEEPAVAEKYREYWDHLIKDPESKTLRPKLSAMVPLPAGKPPAGVMAIFSPRKGLDALDWYAKLAAGAKNGLFMTFAFGMHDKFQDVYKTSTAPMRYTVMEKATRPLKKGSPERQAAEEKIRQLRYMPENRFAIGSHLRQNRFDRWGSEALSGLNRNVRYVHNKFMIIDPLTNDPIVIIGSANFSAASTNKNDENMLVIRGNKRVADIYLGEFMRLYRHHAFREWAAAHPQKQPSFKHLDTSNTWWKEYFENTARARQRQYFSSSGIFA